MIHTIESEQYGTIEINREKRIIYFYENNMEYQIDEDNMFFYYNKLWKIETADDEVTLKIREWVEIGKEKL